MSCKPTCNSSCAEATCNSSCAEATCNSSCAEATCNSSCAEATCNSSCAEATCNSSCADSSCDCESVCQHTPCKLNQSEKEQCYVEVATDIAKVAIEYSIAIEQTKAAKAKYHAKLALFDKQVAKAKKKKLSKITPCNEAMVYFKNGLPEEEKTKVTKFEQSTFKGMTVNEFTEEEYMQYVMLRKKTNYLKHKLGKTVSKYLVLPS